MRRPLPPIERNNVVPFRRRDPELRYRRRHPVRVLAKPFLVALLIVGVPLWVVSWLLTTPRLALTELHVVMVESEDVPVGQPDQTLPTVRRIPEAWVAQALAPMRGRNLLHLRLRDAEARLAPHVWLRAVAMRKELPHRLHIEVTEHQPVALLQDGDDLRYIDSRGRSIAPYEPGAAPVDLVLISRASTVRAEPVAAVDPDTASTVAVAATTAAVVDEEGPADLRRALALVEEMATAQHTWSSTLSEVEILGPQDYRLVTAALPFPLLVRAGTLRQRVRRLETLLPQIIARYGTVEAVDIRFIRRIIVQPSVDSSSNRKA